MKVKFPKKQSSYNDENANQNEKNKTRVHF